MAAARGTSGSTSGTALHGNALRHFEPIRSIVRFRIDGSGDRDNLSGGDLVTIKAATTAGLIYRWHSLYVPGRPFLRSFLGWREGLG